VRRFVKRTLIVLASVLAVCAGAAVLLWLTAPDVRPLATHDPQTTAFIELRRAEAEAAGRPFKPKWHWRRLFRISPYLRRAVVLTEDIHFFSHHGVDWDNIRKSLGKDIEEGSFKRGGSSITQQVAKNLYLSPSRNPIRKLRELMIAWRLESALGKRRILEIYLNIAEWGPGIFGAEAASRHWFGCSAADLTALQAVRLALALPNPTSRSPAAESRALERRAERLAQVIEDTPPPPAPTMTTPDEDDD
jgi:monofunctional biosynthetic peptidoglycan transglycosylase